MSGMNRTRVAAAALIFVLNCTSALMGQAADSQSMASTKTRNLAVVLWKGSQPIDYIGAIEVFSRVQNFDRESAFNVYTVAQEKSPVSTALGLNLIPAYTFENAPKADILVVPGGGVRGQYSNEEVLRWIRSQSQSAEHVISICGGSLILAKAGLLDGMEVTTTAGINVHDLQQAAPKAKVTADKRFTDNGKILTTAGLSSGIDGSLHLVQNLFGLATARQVALSLEYDWDPASRYSRSALAEQYISFDYHLKLLPGGWQPIKVEGDENHWQEIYVVKSPSSASDIFREMQDAVAHKMVAGTHPALEWHPEDVLSTHEKQTGTWDFVNERGENWQSKISIEAIPNKVANYTLSIEVSKRTYKQ